ncbi:MAG TPA: SIMPL domain-containing protein [Streptosporangiaceae bacterium]|jgi:hypothetical protein
MPVTLSPTSRAIAAGAAAAALLIGTFLLGQSTATPAVAGSSAGAVPAALTAAPAPGAARITVTGTGTVTGPPDQLLLSMGVQTTGVSVSTALASANQAVRAVTGALRRDGVAAADIQTSGLSIQPNYRSSGAPDGYGVSESVSVTLRHLASAGSQISVAARAGGNATVVDGVSLSFSDSSALLAAARGRAVASAKAEAAADARGVGRQLGQVVSMSEATPPQPIFGAVPAAGAAAAKSSVPVHPGSQQLTVTVTVVFALA